MSLRVTAVIAALLFSACASSDPPKPSAQPTPAAESRQASTPASSQRRQWLDMFARAYFPGRSGQVFLIPKQGWFVTSRDPLYNFMHGSPWDYDTRIPILFHGAPFVKSGSFAAPAKQQD